jgi:GGDEF domain-containing protein
MAERIRHAVATASFAPDGTQHPLSVSIGSATALGRSIFAILFHTADLYGAKSAGRNRIELVRMPPSTETPANANHLARIDKTAATSL